MRTSAILSLALLATTGATFDTLAWTRGLDAHNPFSGLTARSPKGGKGGGGGSSSKGGSGDDEDDEDGVCSASGSCPSDQKTCGRYCIPSDAECCPDDWYCASGDTCVSSSSSSYYSCCPMSDSTCDADSTSSTFAELGDLREMTCDSGATAVGAAFGLGALGLVVALGA